MFDKQPVIKIDFKNKKYPYELCNDVVYTYGDIKIAIKRGYHYDGASIPRFFYRIIGSKGEVEFLRPALIHDVCCENKSKYTNRIATEIFKEELINCSVPKWKANLMAIAVYSYQLTQKGWKKCT